VAAFLSLLLCSCEIQHSFARQNKPGNVYEVVGNLYLIDDTLRDDDGWMLEALKKHAESVHKHFDMLPIGTKIEIASVEKQTRSSWNTGRYSYYVVTAGILTKEYEGKRFDASGLIYDTRFGNNTSNKVTLKLVSTTKEK